VVLNYDFSNSNAVEIIGDKMYFSPLLYFTMSENPFKQEVREYPVDFIFPYLDKYTINITIPEGYIVESMPKVTNISMEDEIANFKYNVLNTENKIQLSVNFNINSASIGPEYYDALKNFFKEVINKQNEKIVLKKV
jgi:PKD repeat protein